MIDRAKLHSTFVQYGDTCILGSYAIISNYYTGIPFIAFFKDFCKHYEVGTEENDFKEHFENHFRTCHLDNPETTWLNLTELNKYEMAYDNVFHKEYNSLPIGGLELMKELHDKSKQNSFDSSRNVFSLSFIPDVNIDIVNVKDNLRSKESLSMAAFKGERGGHHISVVGYDSNGCYMIETRPSRPNGPKRQNGAVSIPDISSLPKLGHTLLAVLYQDEQKGS